MERGHTPKILCLATNSSFVPFSLLLPLLYPLFFYLFLALSSCAVKPRTHDVHILKYVRPLYLGASRTEAFYYYYLSIKLFTYEFVHMYLFFTTICIDMT